MKRVRLSRQEKAVENALLAGDYRNVEKGEFAEIAQMIVRRRKDAVLNIRINRQDLDGLKQKAQKLGVKHPTFISELLHRVARS